MTDNTKTELTEERINNPKNHEEWLRHVIRDEIEAWFKARLSNFQNVSLDMPAKSKSEGQSQNVQGT